MHLDGNQKTKEAFERFLEKINKTFEDEFDMKISRSEGVTILYYISPTNSSYFTMTIYEANEKGHIPNTFIKIDRCTLKINYFEVSPTGEGIGSKLLNELLNSIRGLPIRRLVAIPDDEKAKNFWRKNGFSLFDDNDTQLFLDI